MRFQQLKKSLIASCDPIYLVEGDDSFLRDRAVALIKDKYLDNPELNYVQYDGGEVNSKTDEIIMALNSYPFLSPKRIVLIRDYYPTAADAKSSKLIKYLDNPCADSILVIANSAKNDVLKKGKFVTFVDCNKGDIDLINLWVKSTAKASGLSIKVNVCELLSDYCQGDMTKISGETQKLISYCDGKGEITEDDIKTIVTKDADFQIYEVVENIAKGKRESAYEGILDMLDKNTDKQRLFVAVYNHFRRLLFCSISNLSSADLAQNLGIKEYAVTKIKQQSKLFTPKRLKHIVETFTFYDRSFKSGDTAVDSAMWNSIFTAIAQE